MSEQFKNMEMEELLALVQTGDDGARVELFVRLRGPLLREAMARANNRADAEDLVQRTLELIWRDMRCVPAKLPTKVYAYCCAAIQKRELNALRDGKRHHDLLERHGRTDDGAWSPAMGAAPSSPEKLAADRQELRSVASAFAQLPPADQERICTALEEDEDEPARSSTQRSAIRRARMKLRGLCRKEERR